MAGLVILVTALVAVLADAATLHVREAVKPSAVSCLEASGPIPNPQDCGSFLQCDAAGNIVVHQCPTGLEFNAWRRVCDWPARARCSTGWVRPPPPPPPPSSEVPPVEEVTHPSRTPPTPSSEEPPAEEESPANPPADAPACPPWNPDDVTQLPNPNDCGSFYKCDANGVAWLNACPAGLEYNARLRVCDYPANAGCSQAAPVEEPAEEPAQADEGDNEEQPAEADEGDNEESNGGEVEEPAQPPSDAPACPPWNPDDVTQLANPNDCGSFYKCDENGVAWAIQCPAGLHYNAELRVCDYPANAGCASA